MYSDILKDFATELNHKMFMRLQYTASTHYIMIINIFQTQMLK